MVHQVKAILLVLCKILENKFRGDGSRDLTSSLGMK